MDSSAYVGADRVSQVRHHGYIHLWCVCVCVRVFISALGGRERTTTEQRRVEIRKELKFPPRLSTERWESHDAIILMSEMVL